MNDASMGLFHSPRAQNAKATHLTSRIEKIQFFFEDGNKEHLYKTLLERTCELPPLGWRVYCLGSKTAVVRESRIYESVEQKGPIKIFVVDKDFDDLRGKTERHACL